MNDLTNMLSNDENIANRFVHDLLNDGFLEGENRPWANEEFKEELGKKGTGINFY